jgi:hypothetical protein
MKYKVSYCGKKLDLVDANNEEEAIEKVRAKFNFQAVDYEEDKRKKEEERKKRWEEKRCEDCGLKLALHITPHNHRYWICARCSHKFCYTDEGQKDYTHTILIQNGTPRISMTEKYHMGKEKIEQNIERVYSYIFHTLGCGYEDAKEIVEGVLKKRKETEDEIRKRNE